MGPQRIRTLKNNIHSAPLDRKRRSLKIRNRKLLKFQNNIRITDVDPVRRRVASNSDRTDSNTIRSVARNSVAFDNDTSFADVAHNGRHQCRK
jgi:hypothetical protein